MLHAFPAGVALAQFTLSSSAFAAGGTPGTQSVVISGRHLNFVPEHGGPLTRAMAAIRHLVGQYATPGGPIGSQSYAKVTVDRQRADTVCHYRFTLPEGTRTGDSTSALHRRTTTTGRTTASRWRSRSPSPRSPTSPSKPASPGSARRAAAAAQGPALSRLPAERRRRHCGEQHTENVVNSHVWSDAGPW